MVSIKNELSPVSVNAEAAARLIGISRSSIFGLIAKKSIPSTIIAGRRLILYSELLKFAERQGPESDDNADMRMSRALKAVRSKRRSSPLGKASTEGRS